jgi:cytochrome P450
VQDRQLFVFDPASLHSILVKEQDVYEEPPMIIWHVADGMSDAALILHLRLNRLFFGPAIFSAQGAEHRRYRKIMTPAFSSASLRGVIPLFYEVAQRVWGPVILLSIRNSPQQLTDPGWAHCSEGPEWSTKGARTFNRHIAVDNSFLG